jgi:glycosyltransferase involved in cell wall biosynthesis
MSEPLRLAFVVESGTDVRLVEGLAERFRLTVLARRIVGGVEVSHPPRAPVAVEIGPASRPRFARWVAGRLRALGPQRVLAQGYGIGALAAHWAGRRGTPTFMLVCSPAEEYYRCRRATAMPGKPYRRVALAGLSALARLNARVGRHYVVLSQHLTDVVRSHGGHLPVSVIPVYGVDTTRFAPSAEPRADLKAALGLPRDRPLVFFSSRIAPEKDAQTLLAAVRRLADGGWPVHLLHRSGGHRDFAAAAERFGLGPSCTATPASHPDALPPDYRAADLCVQASRAEGLGFSPLEALACGTPVVAAAVGGLRETVIAGETGWTYPPGDVVALADAMRDALTHPPEGARRAARGRRLVQERFERRLVFDRLAALLA